MKKFKFIYRVYVSIHISQILPWARWYMWEFRVFRFYTTTMLLATYLRAPVFLLFSKKLRTAIFWNLSFLFGRPYSTSYVVAIWNSSAYLCIQARIGGENGNREMYDNTCHSCHRFDFYQRERAHCDTSDERKSLEVGRLNVSILAGKCTIDIDLAVCKKKIGKAVKLLWWWVDIYSHGT